MKIIKLIIETAEDKTYDIYPKENNLPFGVLGQGKTIQEAKEDFIINFHEMKESYEKQNNTNFGKVTFSYIYDLESFFNLYSSLLSMPGLEKLTGINQKQLHHYKKGVKKPRELQRKKLEKALHNLGQELLAIEF